LRREAIVARIQEGASRFFKAVAVGLFAAGLSSIAAGAAPTVNRAPLGAFPYAVAFTQHKFALRDALALSPDGRRVAYVVVTPPSERPQNAPSLPNGTPVTVIGAKLYLTKVTARGSAPTISVCGSRGSQWEPSWSPDGRMLAFASDADGRPQLWIYTLKSRACRKASDAVLRTSVFGGYGAKWSPDAGTLYVPLLPRPLTAASVPAALSAGGSRLAAPTTPLIFSSASESGGTEANKAKAGANTKWLIDQLTSSLAAIDLRTGDVRIIVPATATPRPNTMELSPSGRWISYRSVPYPDRDITVKYLADLAVVPASGGASHVVATGLRLSDGVVNYFGVTARWDPTEDRLVYLKDNRLWTVTVAAHGAENRKRLARQLGTLAPTVCYFTRDGRSVVVGTQPQGSGPSRAPRGLALVPLDGGAPVRVALPGLSRWSFLDMVRAGPNTIWQPDSRFLTVLLRDRRNGDEAFVRINIATGKAFMLDNGLYQIGSLAAGGDEHAVIGILQDLNRPPNVYRFVKNFSDKKRLSSIDPPLERLPATSVKVLKVRAPLYDGSLANLRTTLLLPPGAKRGDRLPGIVMVYPGVDFSTRASSFGGGTGNTVPNLVFTSRGFAVIMADVPLAPYGRASTPIHDMIDVLLPQIYKAVDAGYVDINRLAVSGQSYGGYSTASILSQTNLFRAAIAVDGVYDLGSFYAGLDDKTGDSQRIPWAEKGQGRMGEPLWMDPLRYIANSPYYQVGMIHTPLLIVTGMNDKVVPYTQSERLFVGLRRLGRPAKLLMYPHEGHVIYTWSTRDAVDVSRRMVNFLRIHLGIPRPSASTHRP
jgi:dipeptidyl aminopeptidase/acylaminoacyl peptidase